MDFIEAMKALKEGKKVRRKSWDSFNSEYTIDKWDFDSLSLSDVEADDWYIVRRKLKDFNIKWEREVYPESSARCLVLLYTGAIDVDTWVAPTLCWNGYANKDVLAWFDLSEVESNLWERDE